MTDTVSALEIHLKSGSVLTVDATDVSTKRITATGELTQMNWVTPEGAKRKLHSIGLEDIAAVVVIV